VNPNSSFVIDLFPQYLRHSKGEWGGQPVNLAPWQAFVIGSVFGWFQRDGTRRFRTVYAEVARKNGKSLLAAGVGIYGLVADQAGRREWNRR
jgi:phage terminase large subunit-like protein